MLLPEALGREPRLGQQDGDVEARVPLSPLLPPEVRGPGAARRRVVHLTLRVAVGERPQPRVRRAGLGGLRGWSKARQVLRRLQTRRTLPSVVLLCVINDWLQRANETASSVSVTNLSPVLPSRRPPRPLPPPPPPPRPPLCHYLTAPLPRPHRPHRQPRPRPSHVPPQPPRPCPRLPGMRPQLRPPQPPRRPSPRSQPQPSPPRPCQTLRLHRPSPACLSPRPAPPLSPAAPSQSSRRRALCPFPCLGTPSRPSRP